MPLCHYATMPTMPLLPRPACLEEVHQWHHQKKALVPDPLLPMARLWPSTLSDASSAHARMIEPNHKTNYLKIPALRDDLLLLVIDGVATISRCGNWFRAVERSSS